MVALEDQTQAAESTKMFTIGYHGVAMFDPILKSRGVHCVTKEDEQTKILVSNIAKHNCKNMLDCQYCDSM